MIRASGFRSCDLDQVQVRDLDQLPHAWSGLADAGRAGWAFHREIQDGWDA